MRLLEQDIIRIIGRNRKNRDLMLRQHLGDSGQDTNQREIQRALNTQRAPAVVLLHGVCGRILCQAYQRVFLIGFRGEHILRAPIDKRIVLHLANRKIVGD